MKYLILDTNVYLHYRDFEQIDWKNLIGDEVTICVPQRVFEEIDRHKDQSRGKIQKRAKKISARLAELFLKGKTSQLHLEVMNHPLATAFDDPQYHKEVSDDWIILSALQSEHDDSTIIVVSGDNGILLKAKQHGLGFYLMPDELLLAEESSEEEKEIKQLKHQIAKYENRMPAPEIEFEDETQLLTIVKPKFIDVKAELEEYENRLKESHPYKYYLPRVSNFIYSTQNQIDKYNRELDDYFKKKLELKEFQLIKLQMEQRFVKLEFWLSNGGTASLGDTSVFINFPKDLLIYNQKSKASVSVEDPEEPVLYNNINSHDAFSSRHCSKKEIEYWAPRKTLNKHEIKYNCSRLTHGIRRPLLSEEDIYIDIANCGNFSVKWIVIDSELIDPVEGELHVVIKEDGGDKQNNLKR